MDYIFYRIYLFYKRKRYIPIMMGIYFVFIIQIMLFFLVGVSFNMLSGGALATKHLGEPLAKFIGGVILLTLFMMDFIRYRKKGNVNELVEKYKGSSLNDKITTWQIFLIPIAILILSFGLFELIKRLGLNSW